MSAKTTDADKLAAKVAELEAKQTERDIVDLIENSTKVPPAQRDHWRKFANDYWIEAAKSAISQLSDVVPNGRAATTQKTADGIDPERIALARKMGLTEDDLKKYSTNKNTEA
jgi:hypothetical protein